MMMFESSYTYSQTSNLFKFIEHCDSLYKAKQYKEVIKLFNKGIKDQNDDFKYRMNDYYFIACCYAKQNDKNNAYRYLFTLTENFNYADTTILKDKDLDNIKDDNRWFMFKNTIEINLSNKEYNRNLYSKLILTLDSLYDKDQEEARYLEFDNLKRYNQIEKDSINKFVYYSSKKRSIEIHDLIINLPWLSRDVIGEKASEAIFLSMQHSNDLSLMKSYLNKLITNRKTPMEYYYSALLYDRIKLFSNEKQRYGTQIIINNSTGRKYYYLIENKYLINQFRKYCYMDTIEEDMKWHNMIRLEESTREDQENIR